MTEKQALPRLTGGILKEYTKGITVFVQGRQCVNWIEAKLYEERRVRRLAAWGVWCVVMLFALLAIWARSDVSGQLDSRAALEAFCQRDGGPDAAFAYAQAEYLGECTLTQTQTHTLSMMGAGYIEAPVGTIEREIKRQVYRITGADYQALLLSEGGLPESGTVPSVRHEKELDAPVREAFGADEDVFVLMTGLGTSRWTVVWALLAAALLLGGALLACRRSRFWMRHTPLGRQLEEAGGFEAALEALSAETPRFDCSKLALTGRWVLVKRAVDENPARVRWQLYPAAGLQASFANDEDGNCELHLSLPDRGEIARVYLDEAQAGRAREAFSA